jgi:prepilin-type N-terminal cleavage/methylation domain-containing protein
MKRRARDARGMTLIELMITLVVLTLVSGAIMSLFQATLKAYWKGTINTQAQQGGRIGFERLTREIRAARRLYTGTSAGFTFSLACSPSAPEISFVLPHYALVTLSGTPTTQVYTTDMSAQGQMPYDGTYVSYYLAASQPTPTNETPTPNSTGPYFVRTTYTISSSTLSSSTIASNVTALSFLDAVTAACPTTSSRQLTVTLTAYQQAAGQGNAISSTDIITENVELRNQ